MLLDLINCKHILIIAAVFYIVALNFCGGKTNQIRHGYKSDRCWMLKMQMSLKHWWEKHIWVSWNVWTYLTRGLYVHHSNICAMLTMSMHFTFACRFLCVMLQTSTFACQCLVSRKLTLKKYEPGPHQTMTCFTPCTFTLTEAICTTSRHTCDFRNVPVADVLPRGLCLQQPTNTKRE